MLTAGRASMPSTRWRPSRRHTSAARPTSSCCRLRSATTRACGTATGCCSPISAPTASARSPTCCSTPGFPASPRQARRVFGAAGSSNIRGAQPLSRDAVPAADLSDTFGEIVSRRRDDAAAHRRDREIRACHVFLQRRARDVFPGEERILVPSPKVATYDLQPEMSAREVTDKVVAAIRSGGIRCRRAQLRQYRHGRSYRPSRRRDQAVETVDQCLGRLSEAVEAAAARSSSPPITATAEMMRDPETGEPHTAHTLNPVPFIIVNPPGRHRAGRQRPARRCRADAARHPRPAQPAAMTGHSLIAPTPAAPQSSAGSVHCTRNMRCFETLRGAHDLLHPFGRPHGAGDADRL